MRLLILGLMIGLSAVVPAHGGPDDASARPAAGAGSSADTPAQAAPAEGQPYRIEVHLSIDPESRIDGLKRAALVDEWQVLVGRFVGAPWALKVQAKPGPLAGVSIEALTPEMCAELGTDSDKFWMIRVGLDSAAGGYLLTGREYDVATRRLGPIQSKAAVVDSELPRALLGFSIDLFNPVAVISGEEGGRALLTVRGALLAPASPIGAVAAPGTIFIPLRVTTSRDGKPLILRIPYTYLTVESIAGPVARCAFVKGISDPLSKRWSRPFSFAAIGIKPGESPLKLRFVTRKDKAELPAAGYLVTTREVPDGPPREVGVTDRSGRIAIKPHYARGLVMVRLLAGSIEPLFDAPMMAGESTEERVIAIQLLPQAVTLETQLEALRDHVVDLVALRARLEARMKARLDGEDWNGLDETIKEFHALSPRDTLAERLKSLKEQAVKQQVESRIPILTKTAQARVDELQALIDRYLDDEEVNAYADALARGRADAAEQAKGKSKTKGIASKAKGASQVPVVPLPPSTPAQPKIQAAPGAKGASKGRPVPKQMPSKPAVPF